MNNEMCSGYLHPALILLLALAFSGCATAGVEKPKYTVEQKDGDFEVRAYKEQVVAETRVRASLEEAGNRGFGPLFRYISGDNRSKAKIPMTAPVGQEQAQGEKIAMTAPVGLKPATESDGAAGAGAETRGEWLVSFMMPSDYTLDTLPEPLDDSVRLRVVPAHRAAAVRYSGRWTRSGYQRNLERLREWMAAQGLAAAGPPIWARYNPPFTPSFLRRNEVLLPLAEHRRE